VLSRRRSATDLFFRPRGAAANAATPLHRRCGRHCYRASMGPPGAGPATVCGVTGNHHDIDAALGDVAGQRMGAHQDVRDHPYRRHGQGRDLRPRLRRKTSRCSTHMRCSLTSAMTALPQVSDLLSSPRAFTTVNAAEVVDQLVGVYGRDPLPPTNTELGNSHESPAA
jgi:hypothetical protein